MPSDMSVHPVFVFSILRQLDTVLKQITLNFLAQANHFVVFDQSWIRRNMASTHLSLFVGLKPVDASTLFDNDGSVAPHWAGRWGLRPTAEQAGFVHEQCEFRF